MQPLSTLLARRYLHKIVLSGLRWIFGAAARSLRLPDSLTESSFDRSNARYSFEPAVTQAFGLLNFLLPPHTISFN